MNRFEIYEDASNQGHYNVVGTYEGNKQSDALDALAKERGFADFDVMCESTGLTRDNYKAPKVS